MWGLVSKSESKSYEALLHVGLEAAEYYFYIILLVKNI